MPVSLLFIYNDTGIFIRVNMIALNSEKIYLDYAATTPLDSKVKKAMLPYFDDKFGNPSSTHSFGQEARIAIDKYRQVIAGFLGCNFVEAYFTSGATEANNLAIKGVLSEIKSHSIPHIITSKIEHKSVLKPIETLEKAGLVDVTYLLVDKNGIVDVRDLIKEIKKNTALISVMYVNNETGVIQPIGKIRDSIKEWKTENRSVLGIQYPLFHIDAAQAIGYLPVNVRNLNCDLLSLSGHKIYGPKGIGALYVKDGTPIAPLIEGGGQENGLRGGTENVAGIAGFGKAVELLREQDSIFNPQERSNRLNETKSRSIIEGGLASFIPPSSLRDYFEKNILRNIKDVLINGAVASRAPHISNILFKGIEAELLLIALDGAGIMASSGSACQAKAIEPSYVLMAMGLSKKDAMSSIRFSFGRFTIMEEINMALEALSDIVHNIRHKT